VTVRVDAHATSVSDLILGNDAATNDDRVVRDPFAILRVWIAAAAAPGRPPRSLGHAVGI
jgi:hypothetical protein